jgi:hypothetical protein
VMRERPPRRIFRCRIAVIITIMVLDLKNS